MHRSQSRHIRRREAEGVEAMGCAAACENTSSSGRDSLSEKVEHYLIRLVRGRVGHVGAACLMADVLEACHDHGPTIRRP